MSVAKVIRSPASSPETARGEITEIRGIRGIRGIPRHDGDVGIPRVVVPLARVRELPIDPRVAFVLSRIDGQSSFDTLVDVTGFEAEEVLSILARLVRLRAISM